MYYFNVADPIETLMGDWQEYMKYSYTYSLKFKIFFKIVLPDILKYLSIMFLLPYIMLIIIKWIIKGFNKKNEL